MISSWSIRKMLRVGQKVIVIKDYGSKIKKGMTGKILIARNYETGVMFDNFSSGHGLDGRAPNGSGYYVNPRDLKLIELDWDE